eukprot:TRINITY_DN22755_c0_g1_i1.p1 TRINITY_DN22755_c0_g1~~TRINITY_DN22755_c0_g1_i1.p1  ORF type:complete len:125 (+),score=19.07 TRINITY_DN22755_c0_g1_i1:47-421(+)
MAIHVAGGLFQGQVDMQRQTLDRHTGNVTAATGQLGSIDAVKGATAGEDALQYADCHSTTSKITLAAAQEHELGTLRMDYATGMANLNNYRSIYSPSSAAGPVGPSGPTAGYVSPYVAGVLHQK